MTETKGVISKTIYSPEKQSKVLKLLHGLGYPCHISQKITKDKRIVLYIEFRRDDVEETIKFLEELLK